MRLSVFLFALLALACSGQKTIAYTNLYSHNSYSGEEIQMLQVISSEKEVIEFLDKIQIRDQSFLEGLEMAHSDLLVVHAGMRRSTGYDIRIDSLELLGQSLVVHCTEIAPGPNCNVGDALTYPLAFAIIDNGLNYKTKRLEKTVSYRNCEEN